MRMAAIFALRPARGRARPAFWWSAIFVFWFRAGKKLLPPRQRAGVEKILVITFTEKATREMKTRIVAELTRLGLVAERRKVESAYISTIHGFCSRLLQENPFEAGIDPQFQRAGRIAGEAAAAQDHRSGHRKGV